MAVDDFKVLLGAELSRDINIQKELDKIKGLHLNIDSLTINKDVINSIKDELSRVSTHLDLNLNINTNTAAQQAQNAVLQIERETNKIVQRGSRIVQKGSFKQAFDASSLNTAAKEAENYFKDLTKIVSVQERLGDAKNLRGFTVSLQNAEGVAERLNYTLNEITDKNGNVLARSFNYTGGTINDNGVIKQLSTISSKADSLFIKLEKLKAAYSDENSQKHIKDPGNTAQLATQYEKVKTAIEAVQSADSSTFAKMVSNVNKEISSLEILVAKFKNAEYAATSLRTKDIGTIKTDESNSLNTFIEKMKQSGHYSVELQDESKSLKEQLDKVFDSESLTAYLNRVSNLKSEFKAVHAAAQTNEKGTKLQSSIRTEKNNLANWSVQVESLKKSMTDAGIPTDSLTQKMNRLNELLSEVGTQAGLQIYREELKEVESDAKAYESQLKSIASAEKLAAEKGQSLSNIDRILAQNTAMTEEVRQKFIALKAAIQACDNNASLGNLKRQISEVNNQMKTSGKFGPSFFDQISQNVKKFTNWFMIGGTVAATTRTIRKMVSNVVLLDDSLLELSKVSDLSASELKKVTNEAYAMGTQVGKTGTSVIDAVTKFKQAGYDLKDSLNMGKAALVMTNVGDGITQTSEAAGALISILKGFNMKESDVMSIVDKINSVSNQSPVAFDNLVDGLERVSGTMKQAGNSIDQTIGLLTGGFAQLRNMEKVSTGILKISQRLRGVGEDGEAIDGLSAKLQKSFGTIGVAIEDVNGNLRSTYDIIKDYAKVFPTLTSKQKQYFGELAAGKQQISVWNAITQQITDVDKAVGQSIDSVGSASEENSKYLDSISGKIEMLKSQFQELSSATFNSDIFKVLITGATSFLNVLTEIVKLVTPLGAIGAGVGIYKIFKNFDWPWNKGYLKIA